MNTLYQIVGFASALGIILTIMVSALTWKYLKKKYKQRQYRTYWKRTLIIK